MRALLQVIADFTNFNVVTSDTVTGNVTLRLKDVPWDQALDIILQAKGLGLRKSGNVILIAPKDELNAKEKIELEAKQQIAALEPLRTQSFQLNYAKAEDIAKGLTGQAHGRRRRGSGARASCRRAAASIFEVAHQPAVRQRHPVQARGDQALIAKIDIPVRQVLIESRIVDGRRHASAARSASGSAPSTCAACAAAFRATASAATTTSAIGGNYERRRRDRPLQTGATRRLQRHALRQPAGHRRERLRPGDASRCRCSAPAANRFLNLELSALEADGKGKVVSSPRVITADQQKALIEQGEELPYQVATSSGATSLQFRKANLKLEVTPQITPEGNVILDVDVTKDSVGRATLGRLRDQHQARQDAGAGRERRHGRDRRHLRAERARGRDQGAVARRRALPRLPVQDEDATTSTKTELLIFLTPKVVTDRTAAR